MKPIARGTLAVIALLLVVVGTPPSPSGENWLRTYASRIPLSTGIPENPEARDEAEFMMLRDPVANAIPRGIRMREANFAWRLPVRRATMVRNHPNGPLQALVLTWVERGPNNVGGRTRAFAVDVTTPGTLFAGSVAGGVWKSTDDGASWSLKTAPSQIHGTTCIAQDRRTGQTGTWYLGTGEIRGSTTNATRWGSLYLGDGIFKSTDNGETWTLLPSTSSATPHVVDPFDYMINVATNPANLAADEVLAATYKGIYRSTDGGGSWAQALASDSGFTEVAITAQGVMYASTRIAGAIQVWRSANGTTWTSIKPGTFPASAGRVVITPAPSNPNGVYLFVQGASNSPAVNGHQVWKYTYISGDGSGVGGLWENRSANLPSDINTQSGYDQVLHVKPDNENLVLVGGTNLYRTTNGFTGAGTTQIGGYGYWPGPHHPDMQSGGFSPANPNIYYSSHDGGVSKTVDITVGAPPWTSLNNGYNVTQFYSVAIAPDAGSDVILAGAQDNGSQLGTSPGASDWVMAYGGDGTVVEVSPAADDRLYTQWQGGNIQRQRWNGADVVDFTPTGSANKMFVNPIVLDPNNSVLLYYGAGVAANTSRIWRNDNAPIATSATGWNALAATDVGAGAGYNRTISAMGISAANAPNVLYYGTVDGVVKRAENVHTNAPTVTDVTPPGLNGGTITGGFVRCVAVDPTDSQRALVAFGNYNFPSLWYTTNGGASWTDVEGNIAGASGPSVRWATMLYVEGQLHVFLATSIGVLSTTALAGASTVWVQEAADEIGNVIIGYMDYRPSDRTLAIGTHARGVFTTQIPLVVAVGDGPERTGVALAPSRPNPARYLATIAYDLPRAAEVSLRLYDVAGREVAVLAQGPHEAGRHEVSVATGRFASSTYYCVLRAAGQVRTRSLVVTR